MFNLKISKILLFLYVSLGVLGIINFCFLPFSAHFLVVITLAFICMWYTYFRQDGLLSHPNSIVALQPMSSSNWQLHLKNRQCINAYLEGESVVTALVCVLRFRTNQGRLFICILFRDTLSDTDYHRLLLLTKLG